MNIDPATGNPLPDLNILSNHVASRSDEINNGNWRRGSYRPEDHGGNDDGDRLRLTRAIARINKSTDDPNNPTEADDTINSVKASENLTFALEPTLTAFVDNAPGANIIVTDTLPKELSYVSNSANIAPTSVTNNGDGTTTLVWELNYYSPNTPIPTITFDAKAGFDIAGGTDATNEVFIAALDGNGDPLDSSPLESRSDTRSIIISNNAAFSIFKEANAPEINPGEDIVYNLYLANLSADIDVAAGSEFIDILPYEGDGAIRNPFDGTGTPPTNYTDTPRFKDIQDIDNAGFTFKYTNDTPANINNDPDNQSSTTVWCERTDFGVVANCPVNDAEVTAILITAPAINAGDPTRQLRLTMDSVGSLGNDVYTNNFKGTPNHPSLNFIPSADATVRTRIGPSTPANIGDFVWNDTNGNGIQDGGESGVDNVTVKLFRASDRNDLNATPVKTVTTAGNGEYLFEDVTPGDYFIEYVAPAGQQFTSRDAGSPNNDALDSDPDSTGRTADFTVQPGVNNLDLDAGFVEAKDPRVTLVKRITALNDHVTTVGGDDLALYMEDPSDPNDDAYDPDDVQTNQWPEDASNTPLLVGGINGGDVVPNDEIEYTIYFLSAGETTANNVLICDYVPEFTSFIPGAFNDGPHSQALGGIIGADLSVEVYQNGSPAYYTGADDGDSVIYYDPGNDPASDFPGIDCEGDGVAGNANPNGAIVVNLGDITHASAATNIETESYGYVRFRARVK